MCRLWDRIGDQIMGALVTPFPPVRHGLGALAKLPTVGGLSFLRTMVSPARSLAGHWFHGEGAKMLMGGNAAHADISMDAPGSGLMGWLMCHARPTAGVSGAPGRRPDALEAMARLLESLGGQIRTSNRAEEVLVKQGRAVDVRTEHGEVIRVRQAVIADVSAPSLYGGLVNAEHLTARVRREMGSFEWDPGTAKVDWALDKPVPWRRRPPQSPGTVHLIESIDDLARWQQQVRSGEIPAKPFLVVGQMATADPSRAPEGAESLWAYTHVPQKTRADAGDGGTRGVWDRDDAERMADRMQLRLEEYAPGFADRVVARRVLGARDLQERDENLVNGALNGGTSRCTSSWCSVPCRAWGGPRRRFAGSASARPPRTPGGVHGACGSNAARAALAHARLRRLLPGAGPRVGTAG
jgi:phytoene dehydrogenase-like protein